MIRAKTGRTTPRQAIVAIFGSDPRWPAVSRALALDAIAAMSAANGFTLGFACLTADDARAMGPFLPAGVDLRLPLPHTEGRQAAALAGAYAERGFERVIAIAADTIGISTRLLSTASSVLAADPFAVGSTPAERVFAVAARGDLILAADGRLGAAYAALESGEPLPAQSRRLEPLSRLREVPDVARLKELVAGLERIAPATFAAVVGPG